VREHRRHAAALRLPREVTSWKLGHKYGVAVGEGMLCEAIFKRKALARRARVLDLGGGLLRFCLHGLFIEGFAEQLFHLKRGETS